MSATAELECPVAWGTLDRGWLVCADGNVPYGSGFVWRTPGSSGRIDAAIGALQSLHGELVSEQRGLLIGYSMGATPAWHYLEHSSEPWTGLVLLNTKFQVSAAVVKARGLARVALVAGQFDSSADVMRGSARSLARQGVDARFFQLEATGHYFDEKTAQRMLVPLRWALGSESSALSP